MKRINNLIAISAFSFLVLCLPGIASAQYGGQTDPYSRNGGYNNGRYGNGQYGDMRSIVGNLKNHASLFQRQLDRDLDNSRYNGTRREDEINQLAKDFKNAVNRLKSNNSYNNNQSNEINRVLNLGSQIDRTIGRNRIGSNANTIWYQVRQDLNALSSSTGYYDRNDRNNRGNRNGRNGNSRNNIPSWWPF